MATTYISMYNYTDQGARSMSTHRADEMKEAIQRVGGKYVAGYELLGEYDVMVIAEYPTEKAAMRAAIELSKIVGLTSHTMVAVPIQDLDQDLACYL